jgi:hypothetical protein
MSIISNYKQLLYATFFIFSSLSLGDTPCNNKTVIATSSGGKSYAKFKCDINSALEFVHRDNGGVVHLSSGVYTLDKQLIIYNNTTLEGEIDGKKILTTIRLKDSAKWSDKGGIAPPIIINEANENDKQDGSQISLNSSNKNIKIKNLIINGNRDNQLLKQHSGEGHYNIIDFIKVKNVEISNIKILNGLSDGIFIKSGVDTKISNCNISDIGHSGIFQVEVTNALVENCKIDIRVNSGIRFFGGTNFRIRDNYIFSSEGYGNYGIQISQAYSYGSPMKNVLIENNIIEHAPYAGIALYASRKTDFAEATIRNNIISQCGSKAPNMSSFPNTTIEESGGINIQSFRRVTIKNNILFNNYGSAIWLDNKFYPTDVNFSELDRVDKNATIIDNIIVGSHSPHKKVYGIEKYDTNYSGTTITALNNIFYNNQNGSNSSNIHLNQNNFIMKSNSINRYFLLHHNSVMK